MIDWDQAIADSASLFGDISSDGPMVPVVPPVPDVPEWPRTALLGAEREVLGRYVSDHPLRGREALLRRGLQTIEQVLDPDCELTRVTVAGMIGHAERMPKKTWIKAQLEDLDFSVEVLFFNSTYLKVAHLLAPDIICTVTGTRKNDEGAVSIMAQSIKVLEK